MAEVTAMRNNALPYPVYGVPWTIVLPIVDADGDPVTDGTIDSVVSVNGDTGAAGATPVQIATTTGLFYFTLTAANMTGDIISGSIGSTTAGAKRTPFTLYPRKLVSLATGTSQGGAAGYITVAAATVGFDGEFNGCLCVATIDGNVEARILQVCTASNQQCTVTPGWNVTPDADDTYIIYNPEGRQIPQANVHAISRDTSAADNEEAMFDGTGYAGGTAKLTVDINKVFGTVLSEGGAGRLAAALIKFLDVVTPGYTLNDIGADAEDARVAAIAAEAAIGVVDGIVDTIVARVVGTLAAGTHQPQGGDGHAILSNGTHGNAALKAIFDAIKGDGWGVGDNLKLIKAAIPGAAPTADAIVAALKADAQWKGILARCKGKGVWDGTAKTLKFYDTDDVTLLFTLTFTAAGWTVA